MLDTDVAGIMLTNPNTLGLFEEDIAEIAAAVHEVGGLLYYDGANLNAILGVVRPGDMGFDIVHMNLHKTFATPHGGGGPGAGPVAVSARLVDFLPGPRADRVQASEPEQPDAFQWMTPPHSIGRIHSWHGNALVLARALAYITVHGGDGLRRVAERAVLNANWIRKRLSGVYDVPFDRPCMHEVVLSASTLRKQHGTKALDVAKRLLGGGLSQPHDLLPADCGRGHHDRADRDRESADARSVGRRLGAHCRGGRGGPGHWEKLPMPRRCAGSTKRVRLERSCQPLTPVREPALAVLAQTERVTNGVGVHDEHTVRFFDGTAEHWRTELDCSG